MESEEREPQTAFPRPTSDPTPLDGSSERLWATLAHVLSFVAAYVALGFLAPLAVLLVFGARSPYVRAHSVESLNFQLTALALAAVGVVLGVLTLGIGLVILLPIAAIYVVFYAVVVIIASLRANHGLSYRYPLTIRFVK